MRINLMTGGKRPLLAKLSMELFKWRAGVYAGPTVAITYRPDLLNQDLAGYILRGMHGSGGWTKGEAELFAAFVSHLNSCNF